MLSYDKDNLRKAKAEGIEVRSISMSSFLPSFLPSLPPSLPPSLVVLTAYIYLSHSLCSPLPPSLPQALTLAALVSSTHPQHMDLLAVPSSSAEAYKGAGGGGGGGGGKGGKDGL